jgi:hypothetical protein
MVSPYNCRIIPQPERARKCEGLLKRHRPWVVFRVAVGEDGRLLGAASMSFKVIDGDGPDKQERDRQWAKQEFSEAIRETAANMLRIIRGAGKPHELLGQMKAAIDSAIKFRELHNQWPFDVISTDLLLEDEMETILAKGQRGEIDEARIDRWWKDGRFDRMMAKHTISKGVLRVIASELIGQDLQKSHGDDEFHQGIQHWIRVRDERIQKDREAAKAARPAPAKRKPRKPSGPVVL